MNSNGVLQWKYSYLPPGSDAYAAGIYYNNNEITVINRSNNDVVHIDFLKLNYLTGSLVNYKGWKSNIGYPTGFSSELTNLVYSVQLHNGNYCVYGETFGDYNFTPADMPHFAVLQFDANYNYVQGYTISTPLVVNPNETRIKVDKFGQALYMITENLIYPDKNKFIGSSSVDGHIYSQRKREYRNLEIFFDNFEIFSDHSYAYINNQATLGQDNFYLEYSKMHNSDTSSECLGMLYNFSDIIPVQYIPYEFTWSSIQNNPLLETNNQNNNSIPIMYTGMAPCVQNNFCDTLKIHGPFTLCNTGQTLVFTAFKNLECGAWVNWKIDTSVIQSFQQINDTTIQFQFSQNWKGYLYGEILTTCGLIKDSILITVLNSPGQVMLGPDSSICPNNALILNAHEDYINYLWQNGSVDSIFTVTAPGSYWVQVKDACNNVFRDTIFISQAPPILFDIGPNLTKCNSDSLNITVPAGFMNYSWSPNYNISKTNGQNVFIFPSVDTMYKIAAEKTQGCFAYDSIYINVNNSQPINLGTDTSFCAGNSVVLNAGNGFLNYLWSSGQSTQSISVSNAGTYSVIATDANNCSSKDTLKVLNVFNNLVLNLPKDSLLCKGSTKNLNAGSALNSYLWNTGATTNSISVTNVGIYWVDVIDNNGCKGTDTTRITRLLALPTAFLQTDTVLCSYSTLQLTSLYPYTSYFWSNGALQKSITISKAGTYWLRVTDNFNCTGIDTIIISPKQCLEGLFIPNAFTPNKDGKNDLFRPLLFGVVKKMKFVIYDRWGQKVYETSKIYEGWNGKVSGKDTDTNLFIWTCEYQFEGQNKKFAKGTVVLIR